MQGKSNGLTARSFSADLRPADRQDQKFRIRSAPISKLNSLSERIWQRLRQIGSLEGPKRLAARKKSRSTNCDMHVSSCTPHASLTCSFRIRQASMKPMQEVGARKPPWRPVKGVKCALVSYSLLCQKTNFSTSAPKVSVQQSLDHGEPIEAHVNHQDGCFHLGLAKPSRDLVGLQEKSTPRPLRFYRRPPRLAQVSHIDWGHGSGHTHSLS